LRGHKDQVTGVAFINTGQYLVSVSKDGLMKLWDIHMQHCMETMMEHRNEIWALALSLDECYVYTGAADDQLRVWSLNKDLLGRSLREEQGILEQHQYQILRYEGSIQKQSQERTLALYWVLSEETLLVCAVSSYYYLVWDFFFFFFLLL
jgi:U3 small nucleolar RNA-associated protein 12